MKRLYYIFLIIALVLIADQSLKIWVKDNMHLGQEFNLIGDWFIIHFTENNGMAFGMEFAGSYGKIILTVFRLCAICGIGYGIHYLLKHKYPMGLLLAVSLIFAGALGNIIDSVFYGYIYGYAPVFYGKVVDMFYLPIIHTDLPSWIPYVGGDEFIFFRPVFNIADSAISVGVGMILLFQNRYFKDDKHI